MIWIAQDQGLDIRFKTREWKGIISALLDKKIDMIYTGLSITPERAEIISFSDPYWAINQGVAVKNGSQITMEKVMSGSAVTGTPKESIETPIFSATSLIWFRYDGVHAIAVTLRS